MSGKKILIADYKYFGGTELFEKERAAYEKAGYELCFGDCATREDLISQGAGMSAILCCGNPPVDREVFEALPELEVVLRYGIGYNSVDIEQAGRHGVKVLYMPGFCIEELASHSLGLTLALTRSIALHDRHIRQGVWDAREGMLPRRLSGMTIGLCGFGASARALAKIYKEGFGARVIAFDPYVKDSRGQCELVGFDELLVRSDIISIHVPSTPETFHLFDREAFSKMKNSAVIINTSRGPIVDENALVQALKSGRIAGAGLDVYENEPVAADSPLVGMDNVVLTPHSAYYSADSVEIQHDIASRTVVEALGGEVPYNTVNKDAFSVKGDKA